MDTNQLRVATHRMTSRDCLRTSLRMFKKYHKMVSLIMFLLIVNNVFNLHNDVNNKHLYSVNSMQRMVNQLGTAHDSEQLRGQL